MKKLVVILALLIGVDGGAQQLHIHPGECAQRGKECSDSHIEEGIKVTSGFVGFAPRFSVSWQKEFFAEVGLSIDIYRIGYTEASEFVSFGYRNLRPYISGEIMLRGDKRVGGPKIGAEFIMSTNLFGMALGGEFSWYTDGVGDAIAITPRLMLSFVYAEVYYGYNIFVRNDLKSYLGPHRVGISCTLNPRFWRRKKQFSQEYYNTYL